MNDNQDYSTQIGESLAEALDLVDLSLDEKREALAVAARRICDQFSRVPAFDFNGQPLTVETYARPNHDGMSAVLDVDAFLQRGLPK